MNMVDRTVLVTGGAGFIGSALVDMLVAEGVDRIRVLDNDEGGVFGLQRRHTDATIQPVLGDLRDEQRMRTAVEGVDEVLHAAAIKQVPVSEYNPYEPIMTNLEGTRNLLRAASEAGVERVTAVSTDKASTPVSVMGATKLLMERVVTAANNHQTPGGTRFNCVRFGNVLGATDSVVPIFLKQIEDGGPITVTDPEMTRFVMTPDEAVRFVVETHEDATRGEVVVPKMPAFEVGQLAELMRDRYAPVCGYDPSEIDIEQIGPRAGERYHEKLVAADECHRVYEREESFRILPGITIDHGGPDEEPDHSLDGEYTSADAELLSDDELWELVTDEFERAETTGKRVAADGGN